MCINFIDIAVINALLIILSYSYGTLFQSLQNFLIKQILKSTVKVHFNFIEKVIIGLSIIFILIFLGVIIRQLFIMSTIVLLLGIVILLVKLPAIYSSFKKIDKNINYNIIYIAYLVLIILFLIQGVLVVKNICIMPPGDQATDTAIASWLIYHNGITTYYDVVPNHEIPVNFVTFTIWISGHTVLLTFISEVTNVPPVRATLAIALFYYLLYIVILAYMIILFTKKSTVYKERQFYLVMGLIVFILALTPPNGRPTDPLPASDLLFGNFINGTYRQYLSNVLYLFLIYVLIKRYDNPSLLVSSLFLLTFFIYFASPRWLFYLAILYLFMLFHKHYRILYLIMILIPILSYASVHLGFLDAIIGGFKYRAMDEALSFDYILFSRTKYFVFNVVYIFASIFMFIKKANKIHYIYIYHTYIISLVMFSILSVELYTQVLWFTQPARVYIPLSILSLILFLGIFYSFTKKLIHFISISFLLLIISLSFNIDFSMSMHLYTIIKMWHVDPEDILLIERVINYLKPYDVVINVPSYASQLFISYSFVHTFFDRATWILATSNVTGDLEYIRYVDLLVLRKGYMPNSTVLNKLILDYNATYIFVPKNKFLKYYVNGSIIYNNIDCYYIIQLLDHLKYNFTVNYNLNGSCFIKLRRTSVGNISST